MASRWMQPKLAKMARDARKAPGFSHRPGHTIATSNAKMAEVAPMVEEYNGVVTKGEVGRALIAQGKGKRQINAPFAYERMFGRSGKGGERVACEDMQAQQSWSEYAKRVAEPWPIVRR